MTLNFNIKTKQCIKGFPASYRAARGCTTVIKLTRLNFQNPLFQLWSHRQTLKFTVHQKLIKVDTFINRPDKKKTYRQVGVMHMHHLYPRRCRVVYHHHSNRSQHDLRFRYHPENTCIFKKSRGPKQLP